MLHALYKLQFAPRVLEGLLPNWRVILNNLCIRPCCNMHKNNKGCFLISRPPRRKLLPDICNCMAGRALEVPGSGPGLLEPPAILTHAHPSFLPLCFRLSPSPGCGDAIHKSFLKHYLSECDYVEVFYVYNFAPSKAAQDL